MNAAVLPSLIRADAGGAPHWDYDYLASEPTLVTEPKQVVTYVINPKAAWYDGANGQPDTSKVWLQTTISF